MEKRRQVIQEINEFLEAEEVRDREETTTTTSADTDEVVSDTDMKK